MNARLFSVFAFAALFVAPVLRAAETLDDSMTHAVSDYRERLRKASDELNRQRQRIAAEKAPLLLQMRDAENRIISAESETQRFETRQENGGDERRLLLKTMDGIRKNTSSVNTLAHDSLKAFSDTLAPGEEQFLSERVQALFKELEDISAGPNGKAALNVADFLFERTQQALGGYSASGSSLIAESNHVQEGTFAFVGPETYFLPRNGGQAGTVRSRAGTSYPLSYTLPLWKAEDTTAFFQGRAAAIPVDPSSGKALRLKETTGSVWEHIKKGGFVAYAIVVVGFISLVMIIQKMRDLARMGVDSPAAIEAFLTIVANGSPQAANEAVRKLKAMTHELFVVGLRYRDRPKAILEEHLQSTLLRQRLYFERRLPLLAVIATAAPLMGLLGTVIGMVKTFALITVFGTGNAGKLSSGISEVLVATELGLVVAIPTLVAHGFLAHRIQKNLSLLERYALEFVTAVDTCNLAAESDERAEKMPA